MALDQWTKSLARHHLTLAADRSWPLLRNVFHLTYVENKGAAFGLPLPPWLLSLIAAAAVVAIGFYWRRIRNRGRLVVGAVALLLGGTMGNLIDRLRWGYVVDFLDFRVWPVFNVADIAVTVGMFLLVGYLIHSEFTEPSPRTEKT